MKILTNLKIANQLKIGFGIILLLILLLGAISWQQTGRISNQTNDLYEHPLKVRGAVSDLKNDILSVRLEFINMLISNDSLARQSLLLKRAGYETDAAKNFDILYQQYLGPKSDIDEAHKIFKLWIFTINKIEEQVINGNFNGELNRLEKIFDTTTEIDNMLESINVIDQFAMDKANQLNQNNQLIKKNADKQLAILLLIIVSLSLLVITIVIRNIHLPINELIRVTGIFAEGKLDTRSSYNSLNEFGLLSGSFNDLARTIEEDFKLKDHSAQLNSSMLKCLDTNSFRLQLLEPLMMLTHTQVAAIYTLNEKKSHFELFESIGLDSSAPQSFSATLYEGEFGKALISKKMERISGIPGKTSLSLTTVVGIFQPIEIITIPLVEKQEVIAIISLSSLSKYDDISIRLISEIHGPLTTLMNAMIAYRKIQTMGESLKHQNIELESQKMELASQANELSVQNAELEMQKKQLSESNQLKTNFLSNMSHELRTPLNSVIALSGVLNRRLSNKISEEEYSYLNVIERNGKQLLALINDILDLSRIEAGFEDIANNNFNVNTLISEVVELIDAQARQKGISLTFTAHEKQPEIKSDYEKCRHILQNIVANAIKFTEKGEVHIELKTEDQNIKIEISDTGIGIDHEFLNHIFEEFKQADSSNARKYGGTGLGLAIAKKYATLLGGNILVESVRGKGSIFTVILPCNYLQTDTCQDYPTKSAHVHNPAFDWKNISEKKRGEKTILLVEDTEAIIVQMKEMLTDQGYEICTAKNGIEALEQISAKIPDGVILDLMMPEVDGFEVLQKIRRNKETEKLPVVILTAKYVSKDELAFLKHNNVYQLIQKGDINKRQLLEVVSRMLFSNESYPNQPHETVVERKNSSSPVILVVEDNPDNMITIKALLQGYGEVLEATNGMDAMELALKSIPDLILLDIALPEMNGIDLLKELRKIEKLQLIPVLAVTASAMKGDKEQFMASGFNDYISKPIDHLLFKEIITEALGNKSCKS